MAATTIIHRRVVIRQNRMTPTSAIRASKVGDWIALYRSCHCPAPDYSPQLWFTFSTLRGECQLPRRISQRQRAQMR
jgi:hypothetical protein